MDAAKERLATERKAIMRDKPHGMYAKPMKAKDGSLDLFKWELGIMPKPGTLHAFCSQATQRTALRVSRTCR